MARLIILGRGPVRGTGRDLPFPGVSRARRRTAESSAVYSADRDRVDMDTHRRSKPTPATTRLALSSGNRISATQSGDKHSDREDQDGKQKGNTSEILNVTL